MGVAGEPGQLAVGSAQVAAGVHRGVVADGVVSQLELLDEALVLSCLAVLALGGSRRALRSAEPGGEATPLAPPSR